MLSLLVLEFVVVVVVVGVSVVSDAVVVLIC